MYLQAHYLTYMGCWGVCFSLKYYCLFIIFCGEKDATRWPEMARMLCQLLALTLLQCHFVTYSVDRLFPSFHSNHNWICASGKLKKQPAADAFSHCLLKKSALEAQNITHCHFQVTVTLQLLSWNCLVPKDLSLLLKLKNTSLEK